MNDVDAETRTAGDRLLTSRDPDAPRGTRAAVVGHPVSHSLSPVLHRSAYRELGLDGHRYDLVDLTEERLPAFLGKLDEAEWTGLSVTMPLKRAVRPFLASESALARDVGSVNTVVFRDGGPHGDNTDVAGIVRAFGEAGVLPGPRRSAVVVGAGATASSALAALRVLGCDEPVVHLRSTGRAAGLFEAAERLGVAPRPAAFDVAVMAREIAGADLVVSTLPAGAADTLAEAGVAEAVGRRRPALLDVVYDGWPTRLARVWREAGAPAVGGFEMLLHQAVDQVELMTGYPAPVAAMRRAGLAALGQAPDAG